MKYQLGDKVWIARSGQTEVWITCPHCCGKKFLTVITGDGTQHTIDCSCCEAGYQGPLGKIMEYQFKAYATEESVTDISTCDGKPTFNHCDECDVFHSKEEAEKRAEDFRSEHDLMEKNRIEHKQNQNHTWAWNVCYHRRELKRATHDVEWHTSKLDAAKRHAKESGVGK